MKKLVIGLFVLGIIFMTSALLFASTQPEGQESVGTEYAESSTVEEANGEGETDPATPVLSTEPTVVVPDLENHLQEEVMERRNAYSKHYRNDEGSYTAVMYQNPVHYQKGEEWKEIDTRIVSLDDPAVPEEIGKANKDQIKNEGYSYGVFKNSFNLHFSKNAHQPVRFGLAERWIAFKPIGAKAVQGVIEENRVLFPDAWLNTDLQYQSRHSGLKEEIILKSPESPTSFGFQVQLHKITYQQNPDGSIALLSTAGQELAQIPRGFMTDSSGVVSEAVEMVLEKKGNNLTLTLIPDETWLKAPERVYPVTVDPTITMSIQWIVKDAYVTDHWENTERGEKERLEVGFNDYSGWHPSHTYITFALGGAPLYSIVTEAKVQLYMHKEPDTATAKVRSYLVTEDWVEDEINWNNIPSIDEDDATSSYNIYQENAYNDFLLKPVWLTQWIRDPWSNFGVCFKPIDEKIENLKYFRSKEYDYANQWPKLYYVYEADLLPLSPSPEDGYLRTIDRFTLECSDPAYILSDWSATMKIEKINDAGTVLALIGEYPVQIMQNQFTLNLDLEPGRYQWSLKDTMPIMNGPSLDYGPVKTFNYDDVPPAQSQNGWAEEVAVNLETDPATGASSLKATVCWYEFTDPEPGAGFGYAELRYKRLPDGAWNMIRNADGTLKKFTGETAEFAVEYGSEYRVEINGWDLAGNNTDWAALGTFKTPPKPSRLVSAQITGLTAARVDFELNNSTDYYKIEWKRTDVEDGIRQATDWFSQANTTGSTTSTVSGQFAPHGWYQFSIGTLKNGLESWVSGDQVQVPNSPPSAPQLLSPSQGTALASGENIEFVAQNAPATDVDGDPVQYTIIAYKYGNTNEVYTCPGSSGQLSLPEGEYRWFVRAYDGWSTVNSSENWLYVDTTPPIQPEFTLLTREYLDENGNTIYATKNSTVMIRLEKFLGEYPEGYPFPTDSYRYLDLEQIEISPGNIVYPKLEIPNNYIYCPLTMGQGKYDIQVLSRDRAGHESYSIKSVTYDTTSPPTILFAEEDSHYFTSTQNSITFEWDAVTDLPAQNSSGIAGYTVFVIYEGGEAIIRNVSPSTTSYTVTGLAPNERVKFQVKAIDYAGNAGANSELLTWYTLPLAATVTESRTKITLVDPLTPPYSQQIELYLNRVACDSYRIFRTNLTNPAEPVQESEGPLNWYFRQLVEPNQTYEYRIVTYGSVAPGELYAESTYVVTIPNHAPTKPTVSVLGCMPDRYLPASSTVVTAESVDYDNAALTYTFSFQKNGAPFTLTDLDQVANTFTVDGLEDGATYQVVVTAADQYTSVQSDPLVFTVDTGGPEISIAPIAPGEYVQTQAIQVTVSDTVSGVASCQYKWDASGTFADLPANGWIGAPEGEHQLIVRATDGASNQSTNLADENTTDSMYLYRVDGSAPRVDELSVQGVMYNGRIYCTDNTGVTINFAFSEEFTTIAQYRYGYLREGETLSDLELAGLPVKQVSSLSSYRGAENIYDFFADGQCYYPLVVVYDSLGNWCQSVSPAPFWVDGSGPVITNLELTGVTSYNFRNYLADLQTLGFAPGCSDPETGVGQTLYGFTDTLNSKPECWYSSLAELKNALVLSEDKAYYLAVKAVNGVQTSSVAYSTSFTVDRLAPTFTMFQGGIAAPPGFDTPALRDNRSLPVSWTVQDGSPLRALAYRIGTTPGSGNVSQAFAGADPAGWVAMADVTNEGSAALSSPGYTFPDGTYYVSFQAVDAAGNTSTATTSAITVAATSGPAPLLTMDGLYVHEKTQIHCVIDLMENGQTLVGYAYQIVRADGSSLVPVQTIATAAAHYDLTHTGLNLVDGVQYYVGAKALYANGTESSLGWGSVIVDSTAPAQLSIHASTYGNADNLPVYWSAVEDCSQISYSLKAGTTANGEELQPLIALGGVQQHILTNLALESGDLVYITVVAENSAGLTAMAVSDPVVIDTTAPPAPLVLDSGMYTNKDQELHVSWTWSLDDPESGTQEYQIALVQNQSVNEHTPWVTVPATQKQYTFVQPLESGEIYFAAVRAVNRAGLTSTGYSDGILVDSSRPDPPAVDDHLDFIANVVAAGTLRADVTGVDPQSGIQGYYYSLGTYQAPELLIANELIESRVIGRSGLPLEAGEVYFFTATALNNAGDVSAASMSDGVMIVEGAEPRVNTVTDGGQYSLTNDRLFFIWDVNSETVPVDYYEYCFLRGAGASLQGAEWIKTASNEKCISIAADSLPGAGGIFADGEFYALAVRAVNMLGQPTTPRTSDGIIVDTTPPCDPVLALPEYVTRSFPLKWSAADLHSGIGGFEYALGSTRGGDELTQGWQTVEASQVQINHTTGSVDSTALFSDLTDAGTYYLTVRAQNGAGLWSNPVMSGALVADLSAPTTPVVTAPAYSNNATQLTGVSICSNDVVSGIVGYRYAVVTTQQLNGNLDAEELSLGNVHHDLALTDLTLPGLVLENGETYYIAVQTKDCLGQWSAIGYSQAICVDTSEPGLTFEPVVAELVTNTGSLGVGWRTDEAGTIYYRTVLLNADGTNATNPDWTPHTVAGEEFAGSFTFTEPHLGVYRFEMYQLDLAENRSATMVQQIRYNCPPYVYLLASALLIYQGHAVMFTLDAGDADGAIVEYRWCVDGVLQSDVAGDALEYTFSTPGEYLVQITIVDNDAATAIASLTVRVTNTLEGELVTDETWCGSLQLSGSVIVPAGLSLTIEPGTRIEFFTNTALIVEGGLQLQGEAEKPVILTGTAGTAWKGIELRESATAGEIAYVQISGAERALALMGPDPGTEDSPVPALTVRQAIFDQNVVGIHLYRYTAVVQECRFTNNAYFGIKEDLDGSATVTNSVFTGNGLSAYYDAFETWQSVEQLNQIVGNTGNTQ